MLNHTRLQVYLSFSAGAMLGAAFFHMIPEAVRVGSPETVRWSAFGLLALFFLERFFSFHHHETPDPEPSSADRATRTAGDDHHDATNQAMPIISTRTTILDHRGHCAGVLRPSGWPCIPWREVSRWQAR